MDGASCLVTFAITRGTHLQPPAVVALLGLIKACLDLAGVRELIVGVVVRSKLNSPRRVRNCESRIFFANLPNRIRWLYASSFGATRVPRAADVDRDGVGWSVTVPGVGTHGVPPPGAGVPRVAARPGAPRDRRGACPAVSGVSLLVSSSSEDLVASLSASHRLTLPLRAFASQAQYDVRLDTGIMSFRARDEPYAVTYDSVLAALQWSKAHTRRMSGPPAPPAPANAPPPFRTSSEGNRTPRTG